jgi:hypothetical protein
MFVDFFVITPFLPFIIKYKTAEDFPAVLQKITSSNSPLQVPEESQLR